jgi:hypothetical protein
LGWRSVQDTLAQSQARLMTSQSLLSQGSAGANDGSDDNLDKDAADGA